MVEHTSQAIFCLVVSEDVASLPLLLPPPDGGEGREGVGDGAGCGAGCGAGLSPSLSLPEEVASAHETVRPNTLATLLAKAEHELEERLDGI